MVKIEDGDVREVKEKMKMSYGGEGMKMKTCWRVRGVEYE
jgi:hypothetical protein